MVGSLSWWKLSDSREEARLQAHKNGSLVEPAVSPDGRLIATAASESEVKLWSAATHTPVAVLPGHLLGVHSVAFSADGDRLASGSDGREAVKLWDVAIQQDVATIAGSGSLFGFIRFSPDGNLVLAINIDQQVHVWRAPSWSEIAAAEAKEKVEVQQP
jgi:WD40 repeat protein